MVFLVSLEVNGVVVKPTMPLLRWRFSIIAVLVLMFVIPHHPSTRYKPGQVGSEGYQIRPGGIPRHRHGSFAATRHTPPTSPPSPVMALSASFANGLLPRYEVSTVSTLRKVATARRNAKMVQKAIIGLLSLSVNSSSTALSFSERFEAGATAFSLMYSALTHKFLQDFAPARGQEAVEHVCSDECTRECELAREGHDALVKAILSQTLSENATALAATTVEELRRQYGKRCSWWGDLDAVQTRVLYHQLLPTHLLTAEELPVQQRAVMAVAARRAARLYARERTILPVALSCQLLDGVRHLLKEGTFQPDGYSEEQIWLKYARKHSLTVDGWADACAANEGESESHGFDSLFRIDDSFFHTVLEKACTSNEIVDRLVGMQTGMH